MREFVNSAKTKYNLHDILFFVLLVSTFYFTRNLFCRLMMVVFCGYTIFKLIGRKKGIKFSFFFVLYALFIAYGGLNIVLGNVISNTVARTMVISLCLNLLMIYFIVQYIILTNNILKLLKIFEFAIFATALLVVCFSLTTITQGRLGGGTEINANVLGMLCVYGLILCLYFIKAYKTNYSLKIFRILFYLVVILLTGSRKALIMIVAAVVLLSFVNNPKKLFKNAFVLMIVVVGLYMVVTKIPLFYNIIGHRIEDLFNLLQSSETDDYSLMHRQQLIETGWEFIKKKPWTGYGYDCFKLVSGIQSSGEFFYYAHNNYIELLFSGGIIGLVLFYLLIADLFFKLIKKLKFNKCVPYLVAILVSKLLVEYAYVSYYGRIDTYILAILFGLMLITKKDAKTT